MRGESPRLSSRYDPELPFDIDVSDPHRISFHWEREEPRLGDLRIEGTCHLQDGHLRIDQLNLVGPSRYIVGDDGEIRRREDSDILPHGIDAAAWKGVLIGEALGRLRAHYAGAVRFIEARLRATQDPRVTVSLTRHLARAKGLARPPTKGRRQNLTSSFLAQISEEFLEEISRQPYGAIRSMAGRRLYSVNTVKGWLARAKETGWLVGGGPRGVAYAEPGPTLIAYREEEG